MTTTVTISPADLLSLTQNIAQLNLGYLTIAVGVLGLLGGAFAYFNLKPLNDSLHEQKKAMDELRLEAHQLLQKSEAQVEKALEAFKTKQEELLATAIKQYDDKTSLATINKIQETEKTLLEKIGEISEEKDLKLKDFILSEANNRIAILEKSVTSEITTNKEIEKKDNFEINQKLNSYGSRIKEAEEKIKELQVFKYSKEGKMGAIIYSIELLKDAIDTYEAMKKINVNVDWKVKIRLNELNEQVKPCTLETEYIADIEVQLKRISSSDVFKDKVKELRSNLTTPLASEG